MNEPFQPGDIVCFRQDKGYPATVLHAQPLSTGSFRYSTWSLREGAVSFGSWDTPDVTFIRRTTFSRSAPMGIYDRGYVDRLRAYPQGAGVGSQMTEHIVNRRSERHWDPPIECVNGSEVLPAGTLDALERIKVEATDLCDHAHGPGACSLCEIEFLVNAVLEKVHPPEQTP